MGTVLMGAFNVLVVEDVCRIDGTPVERRIQFKFGHVGQTVYQVGDELEWGGNDQGEPGAARVVVSGISEKCPSCGQESEDYAVWIEHDRIVAASRTFGAVSPAQLDAEGFIVLEP